MDSFIRPDSSTPESFSWVNGKDAWQIMPSCWQEGLPPAHTFKGDNLLIVSTAISHFRDIEKSPAFQKLPMRQRRHLTNSSDEKSKRHKSMAYLMRAFLQQHFGDTRIEMTTSHCGIWVVVALGQEVSGVDVEKLSSPAQYPSVAAKLFPPRWQAQLVQFENDAERESLFFTACWTALEARFKLEMAPALLPYLKAELQKSAPEKDTTVLNHFWVDEGYIGCLARCKGGSTPLLHRLKADVILYPDQELPR